MPSLTVHLPGLPPVSHVLKDETTTVGRMKGNTVVIEDSSISLMHARITRKNNEFFLKDLNSTNGTMLNGQPVSEAKLRDQDRVRFADITAQFESSESAVAAAVPTGDKAPGAVALPSSSAGQAPALAKATPAAPIAKPAASVVRKKRSAAVLVYAAGAAVLFTVGAVAIVSLFGFKFANANQKNESVALVQNRAKPLAADPAKKAAKSPSDAAVKDVEAPSPEAATGEQIAVTETPLELAKALKSADVGERRRAAASLHSLGAGVTDAEPALKEALKDSDSEVQMWAALTLTKNQVYDKAAIPVLVRGLQHESPVVRQVVCLSLGLVAFEPGDTDTVIPALTEAINKDADEDVRAAAQSALKVIAPELVQNSK
jgi:predicted component of type VI protein secretion system